MLGDIEQIKCGERASANIHLLLAPGPSASARLQSVRATARPRQRLWQRRAPQHLPALVLRLQVQDDPEPVRVAPSLAPLIRDNGLLRFSAQLAAHRRKTARIVSSSRTASDFFASASIRSTASSLACKPLRSSQKITLDRPDIGPTSISCSRPTRLAGTPEYTASTRS